ncbi:hypothetical protein [Agrococcus baldri]|uniref:Uncharacterized protein n=1 Tax=Agrococcus baldri TaxID=153730 RepID=A0AA87RJG3_9MICO|nr:hypothetical protein [Agrococcus baldri]GEK81534.1 hypothetical protein ABA31_28850 [Agrococcus baldri]
MTDANEDRPLTRRELRARERAAELAQTGGVPPVPDAADREAAESAPEHVGRHSTPSVPVAPEETQAIDVQAASAEQAEAEPAAPAEEQAPAKPRGRFFGRKKDKAEQRPAQPAEAAPAGEQPGGDLDAIEAELTDGAASAPAAGGTPGAGSASVPAPSSARRSSAQIDDVQGLDTVDDAEVDVLEIDEVAVEQPRVSSRRVADVTPAQLEDRRTAASDDEEATVTGPSRGQSQRLPVIVNVVSDTSEHHIADLREQGVAGTGGTSTSSITANALVLPAGTDSPDFTLEGDDGLLVTGSIDVPEGFASSGRGRASIDGNDVDSDVAEGEVTSPETAPVRASKAVSSYANARVQIAPKKQRPNIWPVAIGVGAGAFVVAVGTVLTLALTQGWL